MCDVIAEGLCSHSTMAWNILWLMVMLSLLACASPLEVTPLVNGGKLTEVCNTEEMEAKCEAGEVILVTWAKYGRMQIGRCVEDDLGGAIGCSRDVTTQADKLCSGKSSCAIRVPNRDFEYTRPCPRELKSYLELAYKCVRVCSSATPTSEVNSTSTTLVGYFSNIVMSDVGCKAVGKPWVMTAAKGQTLNLTIYDISKQDAPDNGVTAPSLSCHEYGYVDDSASSKPEPVSLCSSSSSSSSSGRMLDNVYASQGNFLKFWPTASGRTFILEYRVIGCADFEPPDHMTFERTNGGGVLRCKDSDNEVILACQGHTWLIPPVNCTQEIPSVVMVTEDNRTGLPVSLGAAASIIILAAVLVCLTILAMSFMRYRTSHRRKHTDDMVLHATLVSSARAVHQGHQHHHHHHLHGNISAAEAAVAPVTDSSPATARDSKALANVVRINGSDYEHIWEASQRPPHNHAAGASTSSAASAMSASPSKRPAALYMPYKQQQAGSDSAATLLAPGRTAQLAQFQANNMMMPISQYVGGGANSGYPTERKVAREKPIYITARDICTLPPPSATAAAPSNASIGLDRRHIDPSHSDNQGQGQW